MAQSGSQDNWRQGKEIDLEDPAWAMHVEACEHALQQAEAGQGEPGVGELTVERLRARSRQIDFGKNTIGYQNYLEQVPRERRVLSGKNRDPVTPDIMQGISKRQFDGQVKAWRRALHQWDPAHAGGVEAKALTGAPSPCDAAPMQAMAEDQSGDKKRGFSRAFNSKDAMGPGGSRRRSSPPSPDRRHASAAGGSTGGQRGHSADRRQAAPGRGGSSDGHRRQQQQADGGQQGRGRKERQGSGRGPEAQAASPMPAAAASNGHEPETKVVEHWKDQEDDAFGDWVDVGQEV